MGEPQERTSSGFSDRDILVKAQNLSLLKAGTGSLDLCSEVCVVVCG